MRSFRRGPLCSALSASLSLPFSSTRYYSFSPLPSHAHPFSLQFWGRSLHDFHHATLGIIEGFAFAVFFTMTLKVYVGQYRPSYLADPTDSQARQSFPYARFHFMCPG